MMRILNCFSLQSSLNLLFRKRAQTGDKNLEALNAVRVINLFLIILGNTYFYILNGPLQNLSIIQEWMGNSLFTNVIAADLAVDIFFWLSAFLAVYYYLS